MEIEPALVEGYIKTFISRVDVYPQQADGQRYYFKVEKPLTLDIVRDHFYGKLTLGTYVLDLQSQAKFVCFDADDDEAWWKLLNMSSELLKQSVPLYIEPSRRGGHVWLFTPKMDGVELRQFGLQLLREHNVQIREVFPKRGRLVKGGVGSQVRLPLGIHQLVGRRYHFINLDGAPLAPTIRDQIALLAEPQKVSPDFIQSVLGRIPPPPKNKPLDTLLLRGADGLLPSEQIKAAISTYNFVTRYIEVDRNGVGLCPFHDDHNPSFQVSQSMDFWKCYAGCGQGDLIEFWRLMREQDLKDSSFKATLADLMSMLFGD